jgi:hypothetical protein
MSLSDASGFHYAETAEEITRHLRSMVRQSGTDSIRRSMFVRAKPMRARARIRNASGILTFVC